MKLLGLRTALYLRRSKEEHQAASIEVQKGEASRYVEEQGGSLDPDHVFIDDNHGRAEFKKRPALIALLNAAERRAFDAVVVRDESRLGGDTNRTSLFIQDLLDAGVRLFYYFSDEEVSIDGAVDKFMINVRNFASELEREKISQRTHEHLMTKARRGLNVGGRVYGYDNVEVKSGDLRVRVEYKINPEQAAIIVEIFQRYAAGEGLRTIVKDFNARRVPPPRAGKRGTGSWSTSAIWAMLRRERYRGMLVWNACEKTYKGGTKVRVRRAKSEWIQVAAPELRIIEDELWFAAHAQMRPPVRREGAKQSGRPPRYMLSGLAVCGECGGPIAVSNAKVSYDNVRVYGCSWHRNRGDAVCKNTLRRPVQAVNDMLIDWVREHVLSEEVVLEALKEIRRRLAERAKTTTTDIPALAKEAADLRVEIDRLVLALASSDNKPEPVVRAIAERQERLTALDARLKAAKAAPEAIHTELRRMEAEAKNRLRDLHTAMERNPEEARQVMRALFPEPLRFTPRDLPEGKRFSIEGVASLGQILAFDAFTNSASPAGFEPA